MEEGYHGFLMQHQYPFCSLHLNFPPGGIDVNVHPTKQEVRIEQGPVVYKMLAELIFERLSKREDIAQVDASSKTAETSATEKAALMKETKADDTEKTVFNKSKGPEPFEASRLQELKQQIRGKIQAEMPYTPQYTAFYEKHASDSSNCSKTFSCRATERHTDGTRQQKLFLSSESVKQHRIIGQVFETYWLVEFDQKLYIIDQHAAHEKVLYEKTMAAFKR